MEVRNLERLVVVSIMDKGALIGVHQNGVVGSRSGGLVLSKEQLDWVRSYIEGQPKRSCLCGR